MVLVKPSEFTMKYGLAICHFAFIFSNIVFLFYMYFLNSFHIFQSVPHVDHNPWFNLELDQKREDRNSIRLIFNIGVIAVFWVQHGIMARGWFKQWMVKVTNGQFYYHQKSLFEIISAISLSVSVLLYQPINEVIIYEIDS